MTRQLLECKNSEVKKGKVGSNVRRGLKRSSLRRECMAQNVAGSDSCESTTTGEAYLPWAAFTLPLEYVDVLARLGKS